ncbi:type VI secretion system membrane subunit TssM [Vibrio penaeicida]|uniref:Type VI secretion protein IcmF n=1 Tax=Vibrio penaeicida TaxID=104609 RepID=A0AAV5NJK5_9VIBR|nr:type VI secretion system membrane subunit TssM [Vibrio penaeicida]RTZ23552.1 type VI secretion system membrane subunit TssM [Vibrio penaeicida]GLQ70794.1 type VI secretion protein IcmF [Vibrio penaeicida]
MSLKAVGKFVSQKWFVGLIGLIALSLMIWLVGPLIAVAGHEPLKSETSRFLVLLGLMFIWGVVNIRQQKKEKKEEDESIQSLLEVNAQEDEESAAEIDLLKGRIDQAIQVLNKSGKRGKQSIYKLPWYVLIGPPGTGKTTALANSGLEFPLSDSLGQDPLSGIGGTRHCDWWFTNKAVLIDTAGRYTTQDSHSEKDSKAWLGFLGLLKKYRTKRPINGAIVAVSLVSLMSQTRTERGMHARAIKARIQELKNQLGMQFPIYIVFTKADLIAGFNEYFADLEDEERDQLLGFMFPESCDDEKGVISLFNKEFHHMLESLDKRMNKRLEQETDLDKRALIFEFPKQLRMLQANADEFLSDIFAKNAFEESTMIRGVFVVSSVQEGMPIDRVMNETSSGLGLSQLSLKTSSKESVSYFIRSLFEDIIFKEQYLGSVNRHHQKQNRWVKHGALALSLTSVAAFGAIWFQSFQWNQQLIDESDSRIAEIDSQVKRIDFNFEDNLIESLALLDKVMQLPMGYAGYYEDVDGIKKFGLYQGDKIGQPAKAAYHQALKGYFSKLLESALIEEMNENQAHREYLYETLKTYLMLFNTERFDLVHVESWFELYFEKNFPGEFNEEKRASLMQHTKNLLLNDDIGLYVNHDAVRDARNVLTQLPLAERAYQRMKLQFIKSHVPSFRLTDVLGSQSLSQFERKSGKPLSAGVPGFYTFNGFHSIFQMQISRTVKNLMEDNWVYGDNINIHTVDHDLAVKGVRERYYRDYIYEWESLINDISLKATPSLELSLIQSRILSSSERPIESFLKAVQKEVSLTKVSLSQNEKVAAEVATKAADVALHNKKNAIGRFMPTENTNLAISLPGKEVERAFEGIVKIEQQDFELINQSLVGLREYLADLSSSGNNQKLAYKSILDGTVTEDVARSLKRTNAILPSPFNRWLVGLSHESTRLAEKGSQVHLNQIWKSQVVKAYERSIKGRYPFSPAAKREVNLKDFKRFFGYGGTLDSFFTDYLEPFVDTSGRNWRFEKEIGVSQETLVVFQRAEKIRQTFFESDNSVKIDFGLRPKYLDQHISKFKLELGSQKLVYSHGPERTQSLSWPSSSSETRIIFIPPNSSREISHTYEGQWGLYKMLDQSLKARPETRKDNIVMIDLKGNKVQLELIPTSTINPFWSNDMERFSCPQTL